MTNSIQKEIQVFIGEIVNQFNPERIILFGSHAYGNAKPDSDIDLLEVMDFEGRPHQKAFEMRRKIKRSFPLDLLVRRPGDIANRIRTRLHNQLRYRIPNGKRTGLQESEIRNEIYR